jgi:DNA-binding transcriptional MerR regulator
VLSPVRKQQTGLYSHQVRLRLKLILNAQRVDTLREIAELLEIHDKDRGSSRCTLPISKAAGEASARRAPRTPLSKR